MTELDSSHPFFSTSCVTVVSLPRRVSSPVDLFVLKCDVPVRQLLLEEKLSARQLSQEEAAFVELLWAEALGLLEGVLTVPVDKLSLNDVSLFHDGQAAVVLTCRNRNLSGINLTLLVI